MNETLQLQRFAEEEIDRGGHVAGRDGDSAGYEIGSEAGHVGHSGPWPRAVSGAVGSRTGRQPSEVGIIGPGEETERRRL